MCPFSLQVRDGDVVLEIECGSNTALMYLSRLCQGSKGPCIWFQDSWITPNEFQYISGRETAKDWKRSIRHCGKSMKLLLTKGILTTHPPICDCDGCRIASPEQFQQVGLYESCARARVISSQQTADSSLDLPKHSTLSKKIAAVSAAKATPAQECINHAHTGHELSTNS